MGKNGSRTRFDSKIGEKNLEDKDGEIEIRVGTQLKGGESSAFSNILKTIVIHIL